MNKIVLFTAFLYGVTCFSQTKLISHKSHSGTTKDFKTALEMNLFDIGESNLGAAPNRFERNANLDSVIYISKDKVKLVTSEYCVTADRQTNEIYNKKVWHAGEEIVYNSELFSKNHNLDSVKAVLKERYNFRNDIEKTVFIGYDNGNKPVKKTKSKKKSFFPFLVLGHNDPSKPFLILMLTLFSAIVAYFFWKTTVLKTSNV